MIPLSGSAGNLLDQTDDYKDMDRNYRNPPFVGCRCLPLQTHGFEASLLKVLVFLKPETKFKQP